MTTYVLLIDESIQVEKADVNTNEKRRAEKNKNKSGQRPKCEQSKRVVWEFCGWQKNDTRFSQLVNALNIPSMCICAIY